LADSNLNIKVKADISELSKLRKEVITAKDDFLKAQKGVGQFAGDVKKASDNLIAKEKALRNAQQQLKQFGLQIKQTGRSILEMGENLTVVSAGLIAATTGMFNFGKEALTSAAKVQVLRDNVKLSEKDFQLLKKSVAGSLTEAEIRPLVAYGKQLKVLSNEDIARFLKASEQLADSGIGDTASNFHTLTTAILTNGRGLNRLNISQKQFTDDLEKTAKSLGVATEKTKDLNGETQVNLKGLSAEQQALITKKTFLDGGYIPTLQQVIDTEVDVADKLDIVSVKLQEGKTEAGRFVLEGMMPLIDAFIDVSPASVTAIGAITNVGGAITGLLPAIASVKFAMPGMWSALTVPAGIIGGLVAVGSQIGLMVHNAKNLMSNLSSLGQVLDAATNKPADDFMGTAFEIWKQQTAKNTGGLLDFRSGTDEDVAKFKEMFKAGSFDITKIGKDEFFGNLEQNIFNMEMQRILGSLGETGKTPGGGTKKTIQEITTSFEELQKKALEAEAVLKKLFTQGREVNGVVEMFTESTNAIKNQRAEIKKLNDEIDELFKIPFGTNPILSGFGVNEDGQIKLRSFNKTTGDTFLSDQQKRDRESFDDLLPKTFDSLNSSIRDFSNILGISGDTFFGKVFQAGETFSSIVRLIFQVGETASMFSRLLGLIPYIGGLFGGGAIGARADGGDITAGRPYLVGERGAELIVPRNNGYVYSNSELMQMVSNAQNRSMASAINNIYLYANADSGIIVKRGTPIMRRSERKTTL
jgi:hypothetical protein